MKILIIMQRNLGDAIILNHLIQNADIEQNEIAIFTKDNYKSVFENNSNINMIYSANLPVASIKDKKYISHIKTILRIKRQKYDIILDYVGDFRERLIAWFCAGEKIVTVRRGNGFNNLVKDWLSFLGDTIITVNDDYKSIYEQIPYILNKIGIHCSKENQNMKSTFHTIGIHPFASQKCKMWDFKKWMQLIKYLVRNNKRVIIFASESEKNILLDKIGELNNYDNVDIFTENLNSFLKKIKDLDLLIGLDSMSVHAAYTYGIPNIMICGSNDVSLWKNPLCSVVTISDNHVCKHWPCYNRPVCNNQFYCINSIESKDVIEAIEKIGREKE